MRDLQPVEDPGDAEGDDDERVEARPGQPIEPGGDIGFDAAGVSGAGVEHLPKTRIAAIGACRPISLA